MKNKFKAMAGIIETNQNILIFHHTRPDGDCLGAAFGLQNLITTNFPAKKVFVIGNNYNLFSFLEFNYIEKEKLEDLTNFLAIIVDVNNDDRIEAGHLLKENNFKQLIRFDHHNHSSNLNLALEIDDPSYSSCCELLVDFALANKWKIDFKTSTFFYLGIFTDTGGFTFNSVSAQTLALAQECWNNHAQKNLIHSELKKRTIKDIKILSKILNNFQISGKVIYFYMDLLMQKELEISSPQMANFPNSIGNIAEYEIWIYFTQETNNRIRCEFRSNSFNVKQLAEKWGGGGHLNASGCMIDDPAKIMLIVADANNIIANKFY